MSLAKFTSQPPGAPRSADTRRQSRSYCNRVPPQSNVPINAGRLPPLLPPAGRSLHTHRPCLHPAGSPLRLNVKPLLRDCKHTHVAASTADSPDASAIVPKPGATASSGLSDLAPRPSNALHAAALEAVRLGVRHVGCAAAEPKAAGSLWLRMTGGAHCGSHNAPKREPTLQYTGPKLQSGLYICSLYGTRYVPILVRLTVYASSLSDVRGPVT